ncbi:MAG: hypothetical protein CES88_13075 [Halobacteriovorax sp. JY17]|nr:MAG: hypothetical protein CES88_13075 [Halobacteriovorax sp. JY17]
MSGEGRGRIKILSSTTLFSYESVSSTEEKVWKMAVDIPLHGSELLSLYWGDVERSGAKLKGNFARRIYTSLRNHQDSKDNLSHLKSFANGLGEIIYLSESLSQVGSKTCSKSKCRVGTRDLLWSIRNEHLFIDRANDQGNIMRFDFSSLTSNGPKRLSIYPLDNKQSKDSFKVELFFNRCE